MSIEAELASLASYSSLGLDSSIAELEMTRKNAQRQCGRFGKKVVISSKKALAFCYISVLERLNFPLPATSEMTRKLRGHIARSKKFLLILENDASYHVVRTFTYLMNMNRANHICKSNA